METRPTLSLPPVEPIQVDLGLDADRELGHQIADTKLYTTQSAFSQKYEQGIESWFQECAPSEADVLLGDRAAALMLEGQRRGLVKAVVRSSIYCVVLVSACFLVRLPAKYLGLLVPVAFVSGVCMSRRN